MNSNRLLYLSQRGLKSAPKFNEDNENKINSFNGDLAAYFEDLMRRRPQSSGGYINLPKENFKSMVQRTKNPVDLATLVNAQVNYLGHRNLLPHSYVDAMLLKALELGAPDTMLEVLKLHAELVYHPSAKVVSKYLEYYKTQPYDKLKTFFLATKGNYILQRPSGFNASIIELAHASSDPKTVIHAYLDILDYDHAELTAAHLISVFESLNYESAIDHALVSHLGQTAKKLGFGSNPNIKLHQALFYHKQQGYLSSVDLLREISAT
jgi:hypothetical protein